ncbi:MAG: glutamine--fructose-6-phosphate transaminase (isomerizing) [Eubacteriales bacterium]
MCGIIGYVGEENCVPVLLKGLEALEYRGYDSAGIAVCTDGGVVSVKTKGRLDALRERLRAGPALAGSCGIGHTRWATHGAPSDRNAHPHSAPSLTLVHNGIIENDASLRARLTEMGCRFRSETDTEAAALWIDRCYAECGDPLQALFRAAKELRGSFAFGVIFHDRPHELYAMRRDSPLIVAQTERASLLASDIPALLSYTRTYYRPPEDTVAVLNGTSVRFFAQGGEERQLAAETVDWSVEAAQKCGYPHFMLKEIFEEPQALRRTVLSRLRDGLPFFGVPFLDGEEIRNVGAIHIVACGTAMHAGLYGRAWIERWARLRADVDIASEFRYRDPVLAPDDLVLLISQSGETADTLAALRLAKERGVRTLSLVNAVGSSAAREADHVIYTWAGPEIAVASTKAYIVQCVVLQLLAVRLAMAEGRMEGEEARRICASLAQRLPAALEGALALRGQLSGIAGRLLHHEHIFYIGRGIDSHLCTEGALKLKEISYIHCEAYPAGELKHGTISLIERGTPVIALITDRALCGKMISGIREVQSRGAYTVCLCASGIADEFPIPADELVRIPADEEDAPLACMTALQLLAYETAAQMGLDVDRPRNLAKSVTVE